MSENILIKSDEPGAIARGQAVVEAKQAFDRECVVLTVNAYAVLTPAEVFTGEVRYLGKVTFDIIALADGEAECITVISEYSDKIASPDITSGMSVALMPDIVNVETSVEGGTIKAVAVVDATAFAARTAECECVSVPDEGIYTETNEITYSVLSDMQAETVYITDSVSAGKTEKILCVSPSAVITAVEAGDGEIKISGAVYSNIYTVSDGILSEVKAVTPFIKSIPADCRSEDTALAYACVTDAAATLEGDVIALAVTVRINACAVEKRTATVITDVFCADYETDVKRTAINARTFVPVAAVIDTVDGQIPTPESTGADAVLGVGGTNVAISNVTADDGRVTVEGLVSGDIIYYNAETNSPETFAFKLPFSMPLSVRVEAEKVKVSAFVTDVTVRVRRGSVFDVKAELCFNVFAANDNAFSAVGSVKLGAPVDRPDASVMIHIAKPGETLWQAAKALCCSPDDVKKANPAETPYEGGERLIRFCGK